MRATAVMLTAALLMGCGDEIVVVEDDGTTSTGMGGAGTGGAPPTSLGWDGMHVLAVSTALAPGLPFVATANISGFTANLTWLDRVDRATPVSSDTVSFDMMGSADAVLDIPGQANPISGSDVTAEVAMTFDPLGNPCGSVDGVAIVSGAEIPIDGSTFALSDVTMAELPVINCQGDVADPAPSM